MGSFGSSWPVWSSVGTAPAVGNPSVCGGGRGRVLTIHSTFAAGHAFKKEARTRQMEFGYRKEMVTVK